MGPVDLGWGSVAAASALILANGVISLTLRLELGRTLLIASVRTVVQLTLLGYLLLPVFEAGNPWLVGALAVVMAAAAARAALGRLERGYQGVGWHALVAIAVGAVATLFVGVGVIVPTVLIAGFVDVHLVTFLEGLVHDVCLRILSTLA